MHPSIRLCDDHESLSREAARRIVGALSVKQDLLLCAAGGSTPLRVYDLLAESYAQKPQSFAALRVIKLDEWGGIAMDDPGSCERQMRHHLIKPLGLSEDRYLGFHSQPADAHQECARVANRLAAEGPIDVCVLGLGMNGHVAMNEPAAALSPSAHVAKLAEVSLAHTMLADTKTKPTYGLSLGMAEILNSREILLLVSGASKRQPLQRLMKREITTEFPASFVWLHPNLTVYCDRAAAEGLDL